MAEMLLINPRRRRARKARTAGRSAAQRAATRRRGAMSRSRRRARRSNPAPAVVAMNPRRRRMSRRRSNPVRMIRRRRNPAMLGGFSFRTVVNAIKDAAIQGGGAVAFGLIHGKIQEMLPDTIKVIPGKPGIGDAVKAGITVLIGSILNRPTRGLSMKAATGSLTVQAYELIKNHALPDGYTLGYMTPGVITQGQASIGPNRGMVGRYTQPGATPLLNRYTQPGASPLLNGNPARMREGVTIR